MKKILIPMIFCLLSCNNKQNNNTNNKIKTNQISITKKDMEIKEVLEKQLRAGGYTSYYETDYAYYKYNKTDLAITFVPIKKILIKQGYKITDKDIFINKIKTIFGDINRYDDIFYINFSDKCFKPQNINYYDPDGFRNDFYISIENQIILNLFSLPEIIDYQKDYPEIASKEDGFPTEIVKDGETEKIYLTKWKDIKDLAQQRHQNIQTLINRNRYLFNDNKASLVWLKFNDQEFLESLVKVFGYVQDKDLLKWVLDRSLKEDKSKEEEFYKILVTKTCDNKYIFHKEVFDIMSQADAKNKENYLNFLIGRIDLPKIEGLNFSEDTRIKALYCYYATKIDRNYMFSFFPKLNDEKFEEELKRNNYYNIPDFKKLFEDTKNGGIGLPM